jgi:YVTN family beta-propeller protein
VLKHLSLAASAATVLTVVLAAASAAGTRPVSTTAPPVTVWVSNMDSDTVTPIHTASDKAGAPVRLPDMPFGMAITPDGRTVYVVDGDNLVIPINTATGRHGKAIRVQGGADVAVVTPNGKTVWVASSTEITPISVATNTAGKPIVVAKQPDGPVALAITPDSRTVYAVDTLTVVPVATATGKAGKPIPTGDNFVSMLITPNGRAGYVLGSVNTVTAISTVTNKVEKTITIGPVEAEPWAMAIAPDGKTVYVVSYGDNTVVPVNTATNKAGQPIKVGAYPLFIAITPNGKTAYVAAGVGVYPVNLLTGKAGKPIKTPFDAFTIVITPDGKTAWVAGDQYPAGPVNINPQGYVMPISTATNTPGRAIKVGRGAGCLVTTPWRSGPAWGPSSCD